MLELKSFDEIADHIRIKSIYEGLELEELGIELEKVTNDINLFDSSGLDLDSVDALDIIASVQRDFGLVFPEIDQMFMEQNCSTVSLLAKTVEHFKSM
ncbi:phosphopantetheine-binding protein [Marinomonas sp. 2405UD68-3]|uniref:phosphopantetheine-binding protein n=1 Tax=Marinomonas sp. 2405UD68-3 TaxID=3391835 RepID=UPI0039C8C61C